MNHTRRLILAAGLLAPAAFALALPGRARADGDHLIHIYFHSGETALNDDAQEMAAAAISWVANSGARGMEIIGHTDTAEDAGLAMQRAQAVRAYLLAHGLSPQLLLSLLAAAPDDLPVKTGPGVGAPLNRLAVIRIY
jgi:flagellar motor protein MotB